MDVGRLCGVYHFCHGRLRTGVKQIGSNRIVEEVRLLGHHTNAVGQRVECHVFNVMAIDKDTAVGGII